MLSAIISDTVLFRSPTTTEEDKETAKELAEIAGVDYEAYGMEMLKAGADISDYPAEKLARNDTKEFSAAGNVFTVGQISVMNVDPINEKKAENTSETKANIESETEQETIMESSEESLESKLKKVIYEDELKRYEAYLKSRSDLKPPLYPIVIVNVVHVTPNNDINKVFVYIYENAYSFSNGIFKSFDIR